MAAADSNAVADATKSDRDSALSRISLHFLQSPAVADESWLLRNSACLLAAEAISAGDVSALRGWISSGRLSSKSKAGRWYLAMYATHKKASASLLTLIEHGVIPGGTSHDIPKSIVQGFGYEMLTRACAKGLNPLAFHDNRGLIGFAATLESRNSQQRLFQWFHEWILAAPTPKQCEKRQSAFALQVSRVYNPDSLASLEPMAYFNPISRNYQLGPSVALIVGHPNEENRAQLLLQAIRASAFGEPQEASERLQNELLALKPRNPRGAAAITRLLMVLEPIRSKLAAKKRSVATVGL